MRRRLAQDDVDDVDSRSTTLLSDTAPDCIVTAPLQPAVSTGDDDGGTVMLLLLLVVVAAVVVMVAGDEVLCSPMMRCIRSLSDRNDAISLCEATTRTHDTHTT